MNSVLYRLLPVVMIGAVAPCATAAEWAIEPSIETKANLTDNINLTPGVHENDFSWIISPRVVFARRTEATEIAGTAGLGINRFPGNSDLNTDDANLSLTSKYRSDRATYGLLASYVRDSTLDSELATTGIVLTRRQRELITVSPSWNYALTARSSVFAQYQYDQAKYQAGADLTDYTNQQASGGYQYLLSERTAATVSGNYSHYKAEDGSFLTTTYGVNVGLNYTWTENLTVGISVGERHTDSTFRVRNCPFDTALCEFFGIPVFASIDASDNGPSYNASADYRWERTSASLGLSRDINPSGIGTVVQTDRITLGMNHEFSEKFSGSIFAAYLVSRNISGLGADTNYSTVSSRLAWRLDEWWTAATGYTFAYQKVEGTPESATANTVFVSISYNWPKISMSR